MIKKKVRANHKIKTKIEAAQQWVREYYSDSDWDKIVRVGYDKRYRIPVGWRNFSRDLEGKPLGALPYPTEYTYQSSIDIMGRSVTFDIEKNKLIIKPYWWDTDYEFAGSSEMIHLPVTQENIHKILSTIPIDPRPTWLLLLIKRYRSVRYNVTRVFTKQYWWGKKYSHDKKHNPGRWLYSSRCVEDCLKKYFGEKQWMWMVLGGRGVQRVEDRWTNDEEKDIYRFDHHGFVFTFEYKSCPEDLKRGDRWPYNNMWFRVILKTPLGPNTGMYWSTGMERKEFERLLRWIERDYAPATHWADEYEN